MIFYALFSVFHATEFTLDLFHNFMDRLIVDFLLDVERLFLTNAILFDDILIVHIFRNI